MPKKIDCLKGGLRKASRLGKILNFSKTMAMLLSIMATHAQSKNLKNVHFKRP